MSKEPRGQPILSGSVTAGDAPFLVAMSGNSSGFSRPKKSLTLILMSFAGILQVERMGHKRGRLGHS